MAAAYILSEEINCGELSRFIKTNNLFMFSVYILKSDAKRQYYVGYSNNPTERLLFHNTNRVRATKNRGPWKIIYAENFKSEKEAIHRERKIKSWKSRKAIERLLVL